MKMKNKENKATAYGFLIATFVIWGSLYVVSKYALGKLPTFTVSFFRFVIAYLALTAMGCKKTYKKIEKTDVPYLFLIGFCGYFIAVGAQLMGTKYAGASLASLLNSMNPVIMTLFAALILHEKLTVNKIIGIVLALAGVYAIMGGSQGGSGLGISLSLFSVLLWSAVSVMMRKVTQKYESIQITRCGIGIAALCYFPVSLWEILSGGRLQLDLPCILSLLYMGSVCTGVAYYLWNKSLSMLEAGTCSAFYPVQPLVSAALGMLLLGEQVDPSFWMGALLIVGGILVNLFGGRICRIFRCGFKARELL